MDPAAFRRVELALIALNDERRGGVITTDQYIARRAKALEGTGLTEEMLENAKVYGEDPEGGGLTWGQLRWRRRARGEEGT